VREEQLGLAVLFGAAIGMLIARLAEPFVNRGRWGVQLEPRIFVWLSMLAGVLGAVAAVLRGGR
jgi:hypothetical protein